MLVYVVMKNINKSIKIIIKVIHIENIHANHKHYKTLGPTRNHSASPPRSYTFGPS